MVRDRVKELRRVRAGDLQENPSNWRRHPQVQKDVLSDMIQEIGFAGALIAYESDQGILTLIDGHLRAGTNPNQELPVVVLDVDDSEAQKLLATYDPIGAMAHTNTDALLSLIGEVSFDSAPIDAMLESLARGEHKPLAPTDESIRTDGLTGPDDAPDPPAAPYVKSGDLWRLGDHRVLCGDATEAKDYESLMNGSQADLVFTDPPYGVGYDGGAKRRAKLAGDEIGSTIYMDSLPHLKQHAEDHAALYLWYADSYVASAAAAAAAAGYIVTAQIVWVKNNAQFVTSAHYKGKHEPCFYAHRKGKTAKWYGPNNEVTVWPVDRAQRNEYHPTQKPVALADRAMTNSSAAGDLVLDPFIGSGTTLIAAEQLGRICYGMDIEPKYVQVTIERWEAFTGRKAVKA